MFRNMVTSLLEHERITTTEAKAKELRRFVEKTISKAIRVQDIAAKQRGDRSREEQARLVHAMRVVGRMVRSVDVIGKLFDEVAPKLKERPGGYTRIIKAGPRPGDAAPMAIIEILLPTDDQANAEAA